MKNNSCYIINFWLGERRYEGSKHNEDIFYFLKKQIECLQNYKHNLTKIIFNFNIIPEHYSYIPYIFELVPKHIQGVEIEINFRENIGISYGAWSDNFAKYKNEYDYFIFNEDDYFFIQNNWDSYLVNKFNSYDDCGYLCMFVHEPQEWNNFRKHAGSSVGIASTESLNKVFSKFGKLPSNSHPIDSTPEKLKVALGEYENTSQVQIDFGFAFLEAGFNIYDVRDDYCILFQKHFPGDKTIPAAKFFEWNSSFLNVAPFYFETKYWYWSSYDPEFTKSYKPSSYKEAINFYNNKIPYYNV